MLRAAGAPAGLAPGIRLATRRPVDGGPRRRRTDRAPRHAAARPFLADPLCAQAAWSMIPESGYRFSDKIMLETAKAKRLSNLTHFALAAALSLPMSGAFRARWTAPPGALAVFAR